MIATAKSTLEATGGDPQKVSFRSGNAETLDFIENASVDLVTSATAGKSVNLPTHPNSKGRRLTETFMESPLVHAPNLVGRDEADRQTRRNRSFLVILWSLPSYVEVWSSASVSVSVSLTCTPNSYINSTAVKSISKRNEDPSLPGASELKRIGDEYRERMKECMSSFPLPLPPPRGRSFLLLDVGIIKSTT